MLARTTLAERVTHRRCSEVLNLNATTQFCFWKVRRMWLRNWHPRGLGHVRKGGPSKISYVEARPRAVEVPGWKRRQTRPEGGSRVG